jgi:hypothetical protein
MNAETSPIPTRVYRSVNVTLLGHDAVRWNFELSGGHPTLHRYCPPAEREQSFPQMCKVYQSMILLFGGREMAALARVSRRDLSNDVHGRSNAPAKRGLEQKIDHAPVSVPRDPLPEPQISAQSTFGTRRCAHRSNRNEQACLPVHAVVSRSMRTKRQAFPRRRH